MVVVMVVVVVVVMLGVCCDRGSGSGVTVVTLLGQTAHVLARFGDKITQIIC